eukprot:4255458-Amphidinium_carterae.1
MPEISMSRCKTVFLASEMRQESKDQTDFASLLAALQQGLFTRALILRAICRGLSPVSEGSLTS